MYLPRVVDEWLAEAVAGLPAVTIDGARGVGKTETAARVSQTILRLDNPETIDLYATNRQLLEQLPRPILIDEWQRIPSIWDEVRRRVDAGAEAGSFLLTGSASPIQAPTHSGAGRILRLKMRPMTLAERQVATPTVSLQRLLSGAETEIIGQTQLSLPDYLQEIAASGLPGIRTLAPKLRQAQLRSYLETVVQHDIPVLGAQIRRPQALLAWLRAYAAASSQTTSYNKILEAATAGLTDKPARATVIEYRDLLESLWLLDQVPGWIPQTRPLERLTQAPKHQLVDPGLAMSLLGVSPDSLLLPGAKGVPLEIRGNQVALIGALFESLATLSVRVFAEQAQAHTCHLRTQAGRHEVDLIVERADGAVLAIEVKATAVPDDRDVADLLWLQQNYPDVIDTVVLTSGQYAYRRPDGVAVVPLALLGP